MHVDILLIGGGLSWLALANKLQQRDPDSLPVEACN
jgi:cation diffusion facilitator CzcD-associated flavoprotein CzcO